MGAVFTYLTHGELMEHAVDTFKRRLDISYQHGLLTTSKYVVMLDAISGTRVSCNYYRRSREWEDDDSFASEDDGDAMVVDNDNNVKKPYQF
jgi:hypothetical protein